MGMVRISVRVGAQRYQKLSEEGERAEDGQDAAKL